MKSQIRPLRHSQIVQSRCTALITRNTNTGSRYRLSPPRHLKTIQGISFEEDQLAYRRAYESSAEHCFRRSGGLRVPAEGGPSDEDMGRARRRAKTRVRKLVKELVPNHFTTFTIRESGPVYYTAEIWKLIWGHFVRYLRLAGVDFQYVSVLGVIPRTRITCICMLLGVVRLHCYNMLRRFWHMAIGKRAGVVVKKVLRGPDSLGNVRIGRSKLLLEVIAIRKRLPSTSASTSPKI